MYPLHSIQLIFKYLEVITNKQLVRISTSMYRSIVMSLNLTLKKCPYFDLVTAKVVRCLPKTTKLMTYIFNAIIRFSYLSILRKFSKIILFTKLNLPLDTLSLNSRPISLALVISIQNTRKIYSQTNDTIRHVISHNILLTNTQFGSWYST